MRASRQRRGDTPPVPPPAAASPRAVSARRAVRVGGAVLAAVAVYELGWYLWGAYQFGAAERAVAERNYSAADARLRSALGAWADEPTRLLAVRVARRAGRFEEAAERLRAYRQDYPASPAGDRELRFLRMEQGDPVATDRGLTGCLSRGPAADPDELEAALAGGAKRSLAAFSSGATAAGGPVAPIFEQVRQAADLWLRLRPAAADQAQGLAWRGIARNCLSDRSGAVADFRAALDHHATHAEARLHLALVLSLTAPAEAADHLRILLRQDHPDDLMVRLTLAWLARNTGRPDEARQLLDEVLAAQPRNARALLERGTLAHDEGQLEDAERWLKAAEAVTPDSPKVLVALAALLRTSGRSADAQQYTDRARRLEDERLQRGQPALGPPK